MNITNEYFGQAEGTDVDLYTMTNDQGMEVRVTTYGGIITHLRVPDRTGMLRDVVLGFDDLREYLQGHPHFGAITGRFAGRIDRGRFELDGHLYELAHNDGDNHLHGGLRGFDKVVWEAATRTEPGHVSLILSYLSPHMEEGYPGNLRVIVTYTLHQDNTLELHYEAQSDMPTVLNLTNHSYFNLENPDREIYDHIARIRADRMLELRDDLIPTGRIIGVEGTPYDFREPKTIGRDIARTGIGYDLCYVLGEKKESPEVCAEVYSTASGIGLEVATTEPGLQFYTANFLDGSLKGKGGIHYKKHSAFCLETQDFPDAPNHPAFPSVRLDPGDTYQQSTLFRFYIKD
jgi:aldose 1-epimerase